jgi:hypothetical protein
MLPLLYWNIIIKNSNKIIYLGEINGSTKAKEFQGKG